MANLRFEKWCMDATSKIVFPPDRQTVERELYGHMLDHYEEELRRGLSPKEAETRTLAAMGSPEDIAVELGMIHRPFWGRFHLLTRRIALVMVCLSLLCLSVYLLKSYVLFHNFTYPVYYRYDPFQDVSAFDDAGSSRREAYGEPLSISLSDGYLFILRRYALWQNSHADTQGRLQQEDQMYLQLQVVSLLPWGAQTDISRWFRVRDDLGNEYAPAYQRSDGPSLQSSVYHTAPCVYTHNIWFSDYRSRGASRLELYYDRAGREITLGIDLTGETEK